MAGKRIAKVGNEPAVTKGQTRFVTTHGIAVYDTPGVLWPKIHDQDSTSGGDRRDQRHCHGI